MLVVGTFEHSIELEQAIGVLEHSGIQRNHILVIPMETDAEVALQFVSKSRDRYYKGIEVGMACGTACSVIGISVGFALPWGPIICGLTAALGGFAAGFWLYTLLNKNTQRHFPKKLPEVTVVVQCSEEQSMHVIRIMYKYRALSVGKIAEANTGDH